MNYLTDQEDFWAGVFGDDYIKRNKGADILASNLNFFSRILSKTNKLNSCLEFGSNIGMNLKAIRLLYPKISIKAVEINKKACEELSILIGKKNVFNQSIFEFDIDETFDLTFTKGVLIHLNPNKLENVYEKLYKYSKKYILIAEYFSPNTISVKYRGYDNKLFKRDFAGELMKIYPDLKLVDYGFCYSRDNNYPQDDINWFLLEKNN